MKLANNAAFWGRTLYLLGAPDDARPLLSLAARYNNGSVASISSQARLDQLDGRYGDAAARYLEMARHYSSEDSYRRFIEFMFAANRTEQAWAAFNQFVTQYRGSSIWYAAGVGNRKSGMSDETLQQWLQRTVARQRILGQADFVLRYALREQFIDRIPADDFPDLMQRLSKAPDVTVHADGSIFQGISTNGSDRRLGPSDFGFARHSRIVSADQVPSRFVLLADALGKFRQGRYALSAKAFDRLSAYYDLRGPEVGWSLPYFAIAAGMSGDAYGLEPYLASLKDDPTYYVVLARAAFLGLGGKHSEATMMLNAAFHMWPHADEGDTRPSYQYADTCLALFETTHQSQYRQLALKFARTQEYINPAESYWYALVGYLTDDDVEKSSAVGRALELDPRSNLVSRMPKSVQKKARQWADTHHPFEFGEATVSDSGL